MVGACPQARGYRVDVLLVAFTDHGPVEVEVLDGVIVEVVSGAVVDPAECELRGFEGAAGLRAS